MKIGIIGALAAGAFALTVGKPPEREPDQLFDFTPDGSDKLSQADERKLKHAMKMLEGVERLPLGERKARLINAANLLGIPLTQITRLIPLNAATLTPDEAEARAKKRKKFKHNKRG